MDDQSSPYNYAGLPGHVLRQPPSFTLGVMPCDTLQDRGKARCSAYITAILTLSGIYPELSELSSLHLALQLSVDLASHILFYYHSVSVQSQAPLLWNRPRIKGIRKEKKRSFNRNKLCTRCCVENWGPTSE